MGREKGGRGLECLLTMRGGMVRRFLVHDGLLEALTGAASRKDSITFPFFFLDDRFSARDCRHVALEPLGRPRRPS